MTMIKLKNETEAPKAAVQMINLALKTLWKSGTLGLLAIYDLRELAKDSSYQIAEDKKDLLEELGLLEPNGLPHDLTKNIVLSAVTGEGLNMKLVDPEAS